MTNCIKYWWENDSMHHFQLIVRDDNTLFIRSFNVIRCSYGVFRNWSKWTKLGKFTGMHNGYDMAYDENDQEYQKNCCWVEYMENDQINKIKVWTTPDFDPTSECNFRAPKD